MMTNGIRILTLSSDVSQTERLLSAISMITTVAGTGTAGYTGDTGLATSATLRFPTGVALDASGNLYIADLFNERIRLVDKLLLSSTPTSPPSVYPSSASLLVPKTRKSIPKSPKAPMAPKAPTAPKAPMAPKAPKAPKCDKKSKTCAQEVSEVEVNDILVNSVVSEFPALRRL